MEGGRGGGRERVRERKRGKFVIFSPEQLSAMCIHHYHNTILPCLNHTDRDTIVHGSSNRDSSGASQEGRA